MVAVPRAGAEVAGIGSMPEAANRGRNAVARTRSFRAREDARSSRSTDAGDVAPSVPPPNETGGT
jgi:hypothetical protein